MRVTCRLTHRHWSRTSSGLWGLLWLLALPVSAANPVAGEPSASTPSSGRSAASDPGLLEIVRSGFDLLFDEVREDGEGPPRWDSVESPRHAVMTFMEAMGELREGRGDAWPRALQTIDSSESEDSRVRSQARALHDVLLRLGPVEPLRLPGLETVRKQDLRRYELFPYGWDHAWVWKSIEGSPQGTVVLARTADGGWLFTAETMGGASALLESLASIPPQYRKPTGQVFLEAIDPLRQTSLWRWGALLGILCLGIVVSVGTRRLGKTAGARLQGRHHLLGCFFEAISGPVALGVFLAAAAAGWSFVPSSPILGRLGWSVLRVGTVFFAGYTLFKAVDFAAAAMQELAGRRGSAYNATAMALLRRALRTATILVIALFLLENFGGVSIGSLLAGLGIIGLGLSLAGQGVFKNALGAFNIFLNEPFLIGDWIRFRDQLGAVEDVGLYATKVRVLSGETLTLPNRVFIDEPIENLSERRYLRREMNVAITYDTPPEKIEQALDLLREVLTADDIAEAGCFQLERRAPEISFSHYGDYYLNLRVYYWYFMGAEQEMQRDSERGWFTYLRHCTQVNLRIKEAFNTHGIDFAFPTRTEVLTTDPERGFEVALAQTADSPGDEGAS